MSAPSGAGLSGCDVALHTAYDVALLDLDGVVYIGRTAVPDAAAHLAAAAAAGMHLAYVTNNASRPPATVAGHLQELGIPAGEEDVVTSAQAVARLVADAVPAGSAVFVIGGDGLVAALAEHGLRSVQRVEDEPVAVASGYHPDLRWRTVIDGAILVRSGRPWFASNTDLTVPTPHGPGPGNGVLVAAVASFAGVQPVVAGKPEPPLFEESVRRVGGRRPLVVGDRLDTDIEGAVRAGLDSLLVMTGVTGIAEIVAAPRTRRPSYLGATLATLAAPQPVPQHHDGAVVLGGWQARVDRGHVRVEGDGDTDDWWRVTATAAWSHLDRAGEPVRWEGVAAPVSRVAGADGVSG